MSDCSLKTELEVKLMQFHICCLSKEGRVWEFLLTSGDEWHVASSFLGCGRAEQAKPPINTLDCGHFIDTHVSQTLDTFCFFSTLMNVYFLSNHQFISPLWWVEACFCCQWLHICMARSSRFLIEGRNVPLSTDCQLAINAELLIVIPAHNQANATQMGTYSHLLH